MEQKLEDDREGFTLRYPRGGEMRWEPFQYFPEAHFRKAYDELRKDYWPEIRTDGGYADLHNGKRQALVYYWLDPDTGAALYHVGVNDEMTIPFFPNERTAREYLERRATGGDKEEYKGLSLYKARTRKIGDAVDVLTDQAGIGDFATDGGQPEDTLQIPNPKPERLYFWYNPSADLVIQEEVEPYDVRGIFPSEEAAQHFLGWYADKHDILDTSHLELYSADFRLEGHGRKHFVDDAAEQPAEPPGQASFDAFRADDQEDAAER